MIQQYVAPGSPQDQQRGDMYAPLYEEHDFEPRYIGRKPTYARRLARMSHPAARLLQNSMAYKGWYRALDVSARAVNDARVKAAARTSHVVQLIKVNSLELVRALRKRTRARLVYDFGDALWLPMHSKAYPGIEEILRLVDAVTCDNRFGMEYARQFNDSVHLWPPASQVELFDRHREAAIRPDDRVVLGWIGTAGTAPNLYLILEQLEELFGRHANLQLRLLGVPPDHDLLRRFENVRYSCLPRYTREEMIREVLAMDIGLFPMFDLQESATHGITKALVYMAGGAAVVAAGVGETKRLVQQRVNGMLVDRFDDWLPALEELVGDAALRAKMADAGLATVRNQYSLAHCFESMRPALGP